MANSKTYEDAVDAAGQASQIYRAASAAYLSQEIDDETFAVAQKAMKKADKLFDEAFDAEIKLAEGMVS